VREGIDDLETVIVGLARAGFTSLTVPSDTGVGVSSIVSTGTGQDGGNIKHMKLEYNEVGGLDEVDVVGADVSESK